MLNLAAQTSLPPRLKEVARLVAQELSSKEIAYELGLNESTIRTYVAAAAHRLGCRGRVGITVWWERNGRTLL